MKKTVTLIFITVLLTSCTQNPIHHQTAINNKNITELHLVPKPNTLEQHPTTIESEEIHNPDPPQLSTSSNDKNPQLKEDLSQSVVVEKKDKATTSVKDIPQEPTTGTSPSTTPEHASPTDQISKPEEPLVPQPTLACPNALYDVNQPCDWIHPNLRPVDEQERTVPSFMTSQEAWNWGDAQMMDESSKWYMCGYNRMDGHTNDGTPLYYAYMKSCPTE